MVRAAYPSNSENRRHAQNESLEDSVISLSVKVWSGFREVSKVIAGPWGFSRQRSNDYCWVVTGWNLGKAPVDRSVASGREMLTPVESFRGRSWVNEHPSFTLPPLSGLLSGQH